MNPYCALKLAVTPVHRGNIRLTVTMIGWGRR